MIGHKQIIDYRRKGKAPSIVMVEYGARPKKSPYEWNNPERQMDYGFYPTVYVDQQEIPDLRFLVGLNVHISASCLSDEFTAFLDKVTAAKPKQVFAHAFDDSDALMVWRGEWEVVCQS